MEGFPFSNSSKHMQGRKFLVRMLASRMKFCRVNQGMEKGYKGMLLQRTQFIHKMATSSGLTGTRLTIATEVPRDDWGVSWQRVLSLLSCTLVRLVAFGYKYGLRSDLRAQLFSGRACPQTPLACACLCTHHHWCTPNLKYLPPPLGMESGCSFIRF